MCLLSTIWLPVVSSRLSDAEVLQLHCIQFVPSLFRSPEMLLLLRVLGRTGSIWAEAFRTEWRDGRGERFCFFHLDDSLIPPARIFNWRTNSRSVSPCVQHWSGSTDEVDGMYMECIFSQWDGHSSNTKVIRSALYTHFFFFFSNVTSGFLL